MVHILVVEDDTQLNKIVCSYLNGSGFKAKGCTPAACPGIAAQSRDRGRAQIKGWEAHITYKLLSYPNKTFTREKQIEFEADVEERLLIRGDPSLLELVWTNLFSNAFQYTPPKGHVPLRQISADEDIIVEVIDDGCGMDEKTMAYIFDKFCQGDTSHTAEGNGLGLALAQRIVRLLDGDITVQSEPGKGSVFTVRLRRMFTVTSDLSNF